MPLLDFLGGGQAKGDLSLGNLFVRLKDSVGNGLQALQRAVLSDTQEYLLVAGKNDQFATALRTDRKGNIMFGNYIPEILEPFEGAILNVQKWTPTSTTFVPSLSTVGGYAHNSTSIVTANAGTMLVSQRLMFKVLRIPLHIKRRFRVSMVANSVHDFGFGLPTALNTLIVPNGACVRINGSGSGSVTGVLTFNGTEITSTPIISKTTLGGNTIGGNLDLSTLGSNYYTYDIITDDDNIIFIIQDTGTSQMVGFLSIPVPASSAKMWASTGLPYYERTYNLGTAPASAPIVITMDIQCLSMDTNISLDAAQAAGILSLSGDRHPFTGVSITNHTNSAAPASATLSNTSGGYGLTIKDGKWQFVAVAGAITDYCLFGFQVPVGSRFLVEGVRIESRNTGAAVATSATTLEWALGINSSAVSLATANILRTQIGVQSFPIAAAIEATVTPIDIDFKTPMVVESGRHIQLILNMPVGTATASQIIRGIYTLKGRFF